MDDRELERRLSGMREEISARLEALESNLDIILKVSQSFAERLTRLEDHDVTPLEIPDIRSQAIEARLRTIEATAPQKDELNARLDLVALEISRWKAAHESLIHPLEAVATEIETLHVKTKLILRSLLELSKLTSPQSLEGDVLTAKLQKMVED